MIKGSEITKENIFKTGTVKDFIGIARIGDGEVGKIFRGKLISRDIGGGIDESRTQFSIEISSQIAPDKKNVKKVVLEKFIGERVNSSREIFEIFNLELHMKGLSPEERMEQMREMPHFKKTRNLALKAIGSIEWDLVDIENKLPGAKCLST